MEFSLSGCCGRENRYMSVKFEQCCHRDEGSKPLSTVVDVIGRLRFLNDFQRIFRACHEKKHQYKKESRALVELSNAKSGEK